MNICIIQIKSYRYWFRRIFEMTLEITEFKCPTCGYVLGEEHYKHACQQTQSCY